MKAFHILQNYDKKKYKSQPKFTINAIIDYFEKQKVILKDRNLEPKENNFIDIDKIRQVIKNEIQDNIPIALEKAVGELTMKGNLYKSIEHTSVAKSNTGKAIIEDNEILTNEFLDLNAFT